MRKWQNSLSEGENFRKKRISLPDASEPVSDESEDADQQDQDSCAVLQVVVQLPGHPAQTQQADHLQGAEQAADALRGDGRGYYGLQTDQLPALSYCCYASHPIFAHIHCTVIIMASTLFLFYRTGQKQLPDLDNDGKSGELSPHLLLAGLILAVTAEVSVPSFVGRMVKNFKNRLL